MSVCLGAVIWPHEAFGASPGLISLQLQGVVPILSENGVGHVSAILAVVALSRVLRRQQNRRGHLFYLAIFIIAVGTMILSQTRSAILGFLLGVALLLYFSRRFGAIAVLASAVLILYLATGAGGLFHEYMRRGQNQEAVASLSGRTGWWEFGWNEFTKSPWLGLGAFTSRFTVLAKLGEDSTSTIHNTYLETALGVGIIGLLPVVAALVGTWRWLVREFRRPSCSSTRRDLAVEAMAILGVIIVRSFFSVGVSVSSDLDFFVVLGFAEFCRRSTVEAIASDRRLVPAKADVWAPARAGVFGATSR